MASSRSSNPFLDKDGLVNVAEFTHLAREIDKMAVKEGLKPAELYFAKTLIPKFDAVKDKAGIELYRRKRHTPTGTKARAPSSGARVRMVVLLRNYKGLDGEGYEDFYTDFLKAQKALEAHNKIALRFQEKHKAGAAKKREVANRDFDKNLDSLMDVLEAAGVPEKDIAIGTSMMGKTVIFKLPNGGFMSVGKADAERFKKALESGAAKEPAKPASRGRAAKAEVAKPSRSSSRRAKEEPVRRSSRTVKEEPARSSRSRR